MKRFLVLLFSVSGLAACRKDEPVPIPLATETTSWRFRDSIYSYYSYFVDSNHVFHSSTGDTGFALSRLESVERSLDSNKPFIVFRGDTFLQIATGRYRSIAPAHSAGEVVEVSFRADSFIVSGVLEHWQNWQKGYITRATRP